MTDAPSQEITVGASAPFSPPVEFASPALRIMLDPQLFDRCKLVAKYMSDAVGFTPRHLVGRQEACFAVVTRAIIWNLDPFAVAACTYQTPSGAVGYEGKLIAAVLEASGRLVGGGVKPTWFGDWSKVQGKFERAESKKKAGVFYNKPSWHPADEVGLGVTISAHLRGEAEPRSFEMLLTQANPRNSTLWATDPKTQLAYLATRRFANLRVPILFMGLPFDREDLQATPLDVTNSAPPRPTREAFTTAAGPAGPIVPVQNIEDVEEVIDFAPRDDADTRPSVSGTATYAPTPSESASTIAPTVTVSIGPTVTVTVDEAAEREADRMMAAAARGEKTTDELEESDAAPATMAPTSIRLKPDGSPNWIAWHAELAARVAKTARVDLPYLLQAHLAALENYAQFSPSNAKALRKMFTP